ncbi:MAG: HlyD family efflux transporter periplasmic adaptor subunit [Lachnospiraceae bacterium]|nr:HlyD family efflux transporter periplasmic adaptor subunit [Lachnospiraceae bacterium]
MTGRDKLVGRKRFSVKKLLIILVVLAALAGAGYFIWQKFFKPAPVEDFTPQPVMENAVRMDVERLYNSTGKLTSGGETAVGTATTGDSKVVIQDVYVKIGDMVKAGDVLYTLDMSAVENELAIQQQKLALQSQLSAIEASAANRALTEAQYASADQYDSATKKMERSAEDVNEDIVSQILTAEDVIKYTTEEAEKKAAYESLKWQYEDLEQKKAAQKAVVDSKDYQKSLLTAERAYISGAASNTETVNNVITQTDENGNPESKTVSIEQLTPEAQARIKEIDESLNQLTYDIARDSVTLKQITDSISAIEEDYQEKKTEYEKAKSNLEVAEKAFKDGKKVIKTDGRLMEDLIPETNKGNRTAQNAEQAARESIATQSINSQIAAIDVAEEIRKKQEMLDKGVITASTDGMVTGINISPGKSFSGDNAVVINKLDRMHIVAEIDEGHIADIIKGMTVRVKTDSTGDEVLTGKVVFCAPTPTEAPAATGTDSARRSATVAVSTTKATYRVEIELDEENSRLRIGMTAKLEFVIDSARDCIAVPTACIMTDPEGNSYVRVATPAEPGMEGAAGAEEGGAAVGAGGSDEFGEEIPGFTPIPEGDENWSGGAGADGGMGDAEGFVDESGMLIREVKVTTGVSDGYYTEITSGNIEEGAMIESTSMDYGGMGAGGMLDGIYG